MTARYVLAKLVGTPPLTKWSPYSVEVVATVSVCRDVHPTWIFRAIIDEINRAGDRTGPIRIFSAQCGDYRPGDVVRFDGREYADGDRLVYLDTRSAAEGQSINYVQDKEANP